jgi:hypothetical protein
MSGIEAFIAELDRKAISFGNQYDEEHENEHYYEDRLYELKREGARQGLDALWQVEDMRKKQKRKREKRKYIYRKLKGLGDASEFQVRYGSNGIFINQSNERSFQIIVQDDVDLLQYAYDRVHSDHLSILHELLHLQVHAPHHFS